MCGIVGLFLKNKALEPQLGAMLSTMLGTMCERGPDSAGFAIYGAGVSGRLKLTLRGPGGTDFKALAAQLDKIAPGKIKIEPRATHAVLTLPEDVEAAARHLRKEYGRAP